jgi:hypothetical protein
MEDSNMGFCRLASRYASSSFVLLIFLVFVGQVYAQTASIRGTTTDAQGAAIQGTKVSARNVETNTTRTVETNETGAYVIANLVPATYEVSFEKQGFRIAHYSNVILTVGQTFTLDVTLEVGEISQKIEVNAQEIAPIDLENAQISNLVDQRRITDLPLILRDPYSLILLTPGVTQTNSGLGGFAVNGSRERNNNFLLDGTDNNDTDVPGIAGGITGINPDSTQEFRVVTSNFLPEYGRNTGAIIDVITKSGTNELHGVAYWFGRYDATAARDFFNHNPDPVNPRQAEPKNPFTRNIVGGSIGGPIIKDKTFWFTNFEATRFKTTLTNATTVPTGAFKTGIFTFNGQNVDVSTPSSPNNRFSLPLDPTTGSILALYPAPNGESIDDVRGVFRFPSLSQQHTENVTARVDHRLTPGNQLSGRYVFNRFQDPNPFHTEFLPGLDAISTYQRTQNLSVGLISTLTPNLVNDLRWGGNRTNLQFNCVGTDTFDSFGGVDPVGRGRDYALGGIGTFGCGSLGDSNGQARFTGTYSFVDHLSWSRGHHNMKFGGEVRFVYSNSFTDFSSRAALDFNNASNFGINPLTGVTSTTTLRNMVWTLFGFAGIQSQSQYFNKLGDRTADDLRGFRQREVRAFFQDSYKLLSNLTLNWGVAWQYYGVPFEVNNNFSALFANPSGAAPFTFQIVGPGSGAQLYLDDYSNWEPRVGIAWDPFKNGKTSIRAGYGIFHDRLFGNLFINARGNPPFQQDFFDIPFDAVENISVPPTQVPSPVVQDGAFIFPVLFDLNFRMPYSQAWNLSVQREFFRNLVVEVSYIGTKGNRLFRVVDGNPPQPDLVAQLVAFCSDPANSFGCTPEDLQFTNLWAGAEFGILPFDAVNNNAFFQAALNTNKAMSTYHSLQLNVTKRLSHGLQIQGAFTYSHGIDNASDPLVPGSGNRSFPRNSFALFRERGNSDFDVRRHLVVNFIYEIPLGKGRARLNQGFLGKVFEGWQVTGIYTVSDGLPYDIFGNVDSQHTGLSDRAFLIGDPNNLSTEERSDRTHTGPALAAFDFTPINQASNLGRNVFTAPGINNWDMALIKTTSITERLKFDLRFESYNLYNRVQFGRPGNSIAAPGTFGVSSSQVGRPDGTSGARQIQFAAKFHF